MPCSQSRWGNDACVVLGACAANTKTPAPGAYDTFNHDTLASIALKKKIQEEVFTPKKAKFTKPKPAKLATIGPGEYDPVVRRRLVCGVDSLPIDPRALHVHGGTVVARIVRRLGKGGPRRVEPLATPSAWV